MRLEDEKVRDWFRLVLALLRALRGRIPFKLKRAELQRQETLLVQQRNQRLNLRLAEDIDGETIASKHTECRIPQCVSLRLGTFRTHHSIHLPQAMSGLVY
jgi:hypothetical protein